MEKNSVEYLKKQLVKEFDAKWEKANEKCRGLTEGLLDWKSYLRPLLIEECYYPQGDNNISLMGRIYCRLLTSLQNGGHAMPNCIKFIKSVVPGDRTGLTHILLRRVFKDYEPAAIRSAYDRPQALFFEVKKAIESEKKERGIKLNVQESWDESNPGAWQKFCMGAFDAAIYLSMFGEGADGGKAFLKHASSFAKKPELRDILPNEIESCIRYMGYTLACDFLKELSYENRSLEIGPDDFACYGKADVHLKKVNQGILESRGLKLPAKKHGVGEEIATIQLIRVMAEAVGEAYGGKCKDSDMPATAYAIDKVIWLAEEGKKQAFYDRSFRSDPHIK